MYFVGVELGRETETDAGLGFGWPLQDLPGWTDEQRQLFRQHAEPVHQGATFRVIGSVEHGGRIAVAGQETLQPHKIRRIRLADEDRADAALLQQPNAAQDEGAHHDLADFGGADHQGADMGAIERQRGAALLSRAPCCE